MAISGLGASGFHAMNHQSVQSATTHKHAGRPSLTDIDTAGSSVATSPSATGKIGNKVNITA
jgi:hypothetical protein